MINIKNTISQSINNNLISIYKEHSDKLDPLRLNELYDVIAPNILNIANEQLSLIENEIQLGLANENCGVFHIVSEKEGEYYFFGSNSEHIQKRNYFFLKKLTPQEVELNILQSLSNKQSFKIKYSNNYFYDLDSSTQRTLLNSYKTQRNIKDSSCFLNNSNNINSISLDKLSNLNYTCIQKKRFSSGMETRFVNLLYSTFAGELSPPRLTSPTEVGTFFNSPQNDIEILFAIFEEYKDSLTVLNQISLLSSFSNYTYKSSVSTKYLRTLEEHIYNVIIENLTPSNFMFLNSLFDTKIFNDLYSNKQFTNFSNIINERFSEADIHNAINKTNVSSTFVKIFKRAIYKEKEYTTSPMLLFSLNETDINSWGGSNSHLFSPEILSKILETLQIKHFLDKTNGVKYNIDIFINHNESPNTLVDFVRKIMCEIDDKTRSSYLNKEEIENTWKEFKLYKKLEPNTNPLRKKPKI